MTAATNMGLSEADVLLEEALIVHGPQFGSIFDQTLADVSRELPNLDGEKQRREAFRRAVDKLESRAERSGLCLSGGGIRSATFSLGVLQSLASLGLLDRFHFLSTVSGGGYIGGWLSAWIARAGLDTVLKELPPGHHQEPEEIRRLRAYSNYLAPRRGLSTDMLTVVGTVARNLFLNWLVLLPIVIGITVVPWLVLELVRDATSWPPVIVTVLIVAAAALAALVMDATWRSLPDSAITPPPQTPIHPYAILLPLASLLLALAAVQAPKLELLALLGICVVASSASMGAGIYIASLRLGQPPALRSVGSTLAASLVAALVLGFALWSMPDSRRNPAAFTVLAAPALLVVYWIGASLAAALSGRWASKDALEWWARSGALTFRVVLFWAGLSLLALFGPLILLHAGVRAAPAVVALGSASGLAAALIGLWGKGGTEKYSEQGRRWYESLQRVPLPVLSSLFLALVLVATSLSVAVVLRWNSFQALPCIVERARAAGEVEAAPKPESGWALFLQEAAGRYDASALGGLSQSSCPPVAGVAAVQGAAVPEARPWRLGSALGLLVLFSLAASYLVGINRFSLHGMYANRLVRAYLGASRMGDAQTTARNSFTGYDPLDDISIASLSPDQSPLRADLVRRETACLLPVVGMTLNVTDSDRLDWQDRRAASFVATPLHCGSVVTGYRHSSEFGGADDDAGPGGITIGRAMTVSGAAVSPGMGYHSSTPVAAAMTFFNTRLGWWLANPAECGREYWRAEEPRLGLPQLYQEIVCSFSTRRPFVHVSDGGHFDNLGLYEMVRRRCRRIVIVDATQDPELLFTDLSRTLRLIRVDMGIEIELESLPTAQLPRSRWVRGRIRYSMKEPGVGDGVLILLKPMLNGDEPLDVLRYGEIHADEKEAFPHEATSDQFFDEVQFESYRRLGLHTGLAAADPIGGLFEESAAGVADTILEAPTQELGSGDVSSPAAARPSDAGAATGGDWLGTWLGRGAAFLAPALVSTVAAVTVTGTLSGVVRLAQPEVRLTNPEVEITDRRLEITNPGVEITNPGVTITNPDLRISPNTLVIANPTVDLQPVPLPIALPPGGSAPLAADDLRRIREHVRSVDNNIKTLNTKVETLNATVREIDPRGVVPGRR